MNVDLTTLDNGLRIVSLSRPDTETVTVGIWVNTGSSAENEKNNGISHFIEHMVFKGSQKRTALQIAEDIENVGGKTNAYTSREHTVFYAHMLKNDLELAIDVLTDMLTAPTFNTADMDKEKEVVIQEIKQTYDDPGDIVFDYFQQTAFADQPLGMSILGPKERVKAFVADDLRLYMNERYTADNMVVVAVGNLNHSDFADMVAKRMSSIPRSGRKTTAKQIYTGGSFIKNRKIEQAQVLLGFPGFKRVCDDYYKAAIMSTILGGNMSSRLFQEIREKRGLVYTVYSFSSSYTQSGIVGIYAGLNQDDIKTYIPVVANEIKKITQEKVTDKELDRVKVQFKAGIMMATESSSSVAEMLARQYLRFNRHIPMEEIISQIESINKDDVLDVAQRIFSGKITYTLLGDLHEYPSYEDLGKYFNIN